MFGTAYEMLNKFVSRDGCLVYYEHRLPMRRFLEDVDKFAAGLAGLHLQKGDVVTVYLPSCPQGLVAFYACSKLGLVANIVHPLIPLKLLKLNLQKTNSKVLMFYDALVHDERPLAELGQTLVRCSIADYVDLRKPLFAAYARATCKRVKGVFAYRSLCKQLVATPIVGSDQDVVCLMHSGGTSGSPKIVKLTNDAFNQTAWGMKLMYHPGVDGRSFNLATLPIFHAYGLCCGVHAPLIIGFSLVLVPKFVPKRVTHYLKRLNVTCWSVVPAMLKKLIKCGAFDHRGMNSLDVIWCGGDVLDESLVEEVDAILKRRCARAKLMRGYGLTEVCGVCTVNNYDHYQKGSCGQPMETCEAQIWDENGKLLPAGELGEIVISSGGNMAGYLEGEDCLVEMDGKTWVQTGDIGYLDQDGFLFVVDRKKRSVKIAAVNVFPAQVEACIKQLEFVDEACVVGVKVDDKQYLKAFVTLKTLMDPTAVEAAVKHICEEGLIKYSVPHFVEVISEMPRTPLGKVDFKKLEQ